LSYDFESGGPLTSSSDEISLYFKTRQASGLLFYAGDGQGDYLNLAVRDGGIVLTVKLGTATLEKLVKPSKVRFDDNQWHKVLVHRKVTEV
jgi:leucine-rich repeat transmembrane neuronal protein 1/2